MCVARMHACLYVCVCRQMDSVICHSCLSSREISRDSLSPIRRHYHLFVPLSVGHVPLLVSHLYIYCVWTYLLSLAYTRHVRAQAQVRVFLSPHVWPTLTSCVADTHLMCAQHSPHVCPTLTSCVPNTHLMYARHSPHVCPTLTSCVPNTPNKSDTEWYIHIKYVYMQRHGKRIPHLYVNVSLTW